MKRTAPRAWPAFLLALCLACTPAWSQDLSATLGKERAATSPLQWDTGDFSHAVLGPLRSAFMRTPIETAVGNRKIHSRATLSCQKANRLFAIEVSSGTAQAEARGLKPASEPRLYCSRPITSFDEKLVHEEMLASWEINAEGVALTKNYRPFPLRECVVIRVEQDVALPAGWPQKTVRVELPIHPYNREIDSIFETCGEVSAYGSPAPATGAASAPAPAESVPPPAAAPNEGWQSARTTTGGRTNVRASPSVGSALVDTLDPGTAVLVKKASGDWWMAKSASGVPFEGFIRRDRLVFR